MTPRTIIVIAGPTAVGKTSLAVEVARYFDTEIISADSRQCYKELNIGVAKPTIQQLQEIRHYFIDSHSIHSEVSAATFEQYALDSVGEIFSRRDVGVMVGGTGLYIKTFCEGLDQIPTVPTGIREEISSKFMVNGVSWLQEQVRTLDPTYFETGEIANPQRMIRALEVRIATGKSIREFQHGKKVTRDFRILKFALDIPKEQLHQNIHSRVDEMMRNGLLKEVKSLVEWKSLPALRTVGYTELFKYIDGEISLEHATDLIKTNTRHYAKRQMTWFRKDPSFIWLHPAEKQKIIDLHQV